MAVAAAAATAGAALAAVTAYPAAAATGSPVNVAYNGKCLDADLNTINANGTKVQLWDCNSTPQQTWSGLPASAFRTPCAAYSNGEVWQTSTTAGRVREQPCLQYDQAIVWGVVHLQVDFPASCSVTVGFPPDVGLGCPWSYLTKVHHLSFNSLQVGGDVQASDGHSASFRCHYAGSSVWGTYTIPCYIGPLPRTASSFVVSIHDTGGDVTDDNAGPRLLAPGSFTFMP